MPTEQRPEGKPPRDGVCPECWGWTFHRDECPQNDGKPRPEAQRGALVSTLRDIHERCKMRHAHDLPWTECKWCKFTHPCPDYEDAVAALAALDEAERLSLYVGPGAHTWAVVPDPKASS